MCVICVSMWVLAPIHNNTSFRCVFLSFISANPCRNFLNLAGQDLLFPFERSGNWGSEGFHHLPKVIKQWSAPLPADPWIGFVGGGGVIIFFFLNIYTIKRVIFSKYNSWYVISLLEILYWLPNTCHSCNFTAVHEHKFLILPQSFSSRFLLQLN